MLEPGSRWRGNDLPHRRDLGVAWQLRCSSRAAWKACLEELPANDWLKAAAESACDADGAAECVHAVPRGCRGDVRFQAKCTPLAGLSA